MIEKYHIIVGNLYYIDKSPNSQNMCFAPLTQIIFGNFAYPLIFEGYESIYSIE